MPEGRKRRAGSKTASKRRRAPARAERSPGTTGRWRDAADELASAIRAGELAQGERLPRENELTRRFGLSRHSLRRTLAELARLGLIEIIPRVGARVAPLRLPYVIDARSRFFENVERAGRRPSARILSASMGIAPPEIAKLLRVARRTRAVELHLLRSANDIPMALVSAWLPADRFERIGELFGITGSFTRAFAQLGLREYRRHTTTIGSRPATSEERKHLRLDTGATVLTKLAVDVDTTGEPIKVSQWAFAADRLEFMVKS